jgi:predicted metalloprotease with PDZ domain
MMKYFFSFDAEKHFVQVKISIDIENTEPFDLKLSKWRPGRYQFQNFSKNILNFETTDSNNQSVCWKKTTTNTWQINPTKAGNLTVKYNYYAVEINAGSTFVDNHLQYLNPINFAMYTDIGLELPNSVQIDLMFPSTQIACAAKSIKSNRTFILNFSNIHQLFDTPILLSRRFLKFEYEIRDYKFYFWLNGETDIDLEKLRTDLMKITEYQINLFGEFPENEYHFYLIVPKNTYYHGVEHANSTVMVLGENGILTHNYYTDLLGLASHELFHAWNIAKIRPKELLPYKYDQENYFETCFVAEGYTTYYGDKILWDSAAISKPQYLLEFETTLKRHFDHSDQSSQSLLESSFDLWVDGYELGVPNKKVSVYHKGAVAAFILDSMIRQKFNHSKSLDDVLRYLWNKFGKTNIGYSYQDIVTGCETVFEASLKEYFELVIASNKPIFEICNNHLKNLGLIMTLNEKHQISLETYNNS